jgi:NitT/TauT family transport system permease protein
MNPRTRVLVGPASLLLLWLLAWWAGWPGARLVPGPHEVVMAGFSAFAGTQLWRDLGATVARVVAGVSIALCAGTAAGMLLGRATHVWQAARPTLDFLRTVPPILVFPLFLLGLGYGEGARIAAIALGTSGIVALHVGEALARAPRERTEIVRLSGLRGWQAFRRFHLWQAMPALLQAARLALAVGLVIAVVTEMLIGAQSGLGARALEAQLAYRTDLLWLVIGLTSATGAALSAAVTALERRLVHW